MCPGDEHDKSRTERMGTIIGTRSAGSALVGPASCRTTKGRTMNTAYLEVRTQPARGTWPRQGPDTYVTVQIVPDGQERLRCLNRSVAKKRGIELVYIGEGYWQRQKTLKSALGAALQQGYEFVENWNTKTRWLFSNPRAER